MADLCWQCKKNNERICRTANLPEEEKMQVLGEQLDHLRTVEEEQKHYNQLVKEAKTAGISSLIWHTPNSLPMTFHYSFDFAQQVHLPSSPLQPGPIYFLVPRNCGIFGVCAEGFPQINYLIDEGMSSSNSSITFWKTMVLGNKKWNFTVTIAVDKIRISLWCGI